MTTRSSSRPQVSPLDQELAIQYASRDFPLLLPEETVAQCLLKFRTEGIPGQILYLYVVDKNRLLLGVLPVRKLLISPLETQIKDIYVRKAISLPISARVKEAKEAFHIHRFLALPIVDKDSRLQGVIDIEKFAGDIGDIHQRTGFDDIYELLGLGSPEQGEGRALSRFLVRFPWLSVTLFIGTLAAGVTSYFAPVIENTIILSFFLALVLGMNESVSMQSATLSVHRIRISQSRFLPSLRKEFTVAALLGLASALVVGLVVWIWKKDALSASVISISLGVSMIVSCIWGLSVPYLIRIFNKDPQVAAAPIALGLSDITTLLIYLGLAKKFFA